MNLNKISFHSTLDMDALNKLGEKAKEWKAKEDAFIQKQIQLAAEEMTHAEPLVIGSLTDVLTKLDEMLAQQRTAARNKTIDEFLKNNPGE